MKVEKDGPPLSLRDDDENDVSKFLMREKTFWLTSELRRLRRETHKETVK